ncbi:PEP/pyruvate-binding domain-containing protein [Pseudonocardia sp. GCM10023141]|uniref:PEP/pyruvate-binding domain-containing protein n=1 Tax=Pseudonocardia sp. GCM10023141 TaxID=3252653 RepID=UPI00360E2213
MSMIRRFEDLGRGDIDIAGGKGANLGELTRAGLPVPAGFVLTTDAYREFVAESGIGPRIQELAALPADAAPADYEEPSARIRALFDTAEIPETTMREILAARVPLGETAVAVRSSATAEDLEGASFAGQQDTYLNVRSADALLAAIRDCWASLWTARAMAYRARQRIAPAAVALAVVVQRMVDADAAGVLFTANPINGHRGEAVVSAAWGLGESVVSGSVTTDDLVVDKQAGAVLSRATADKAVMTVYAVTGTEERPVPVAQRSRPVLDDAAAVELAALGSRIEGRFGAPQDIEWARAGGTFWIVQSRPITALPAPEVDPPTDWVVPRPRDYYFRASIVEQLPDPLSPLFEDLGAPSVVRGLQAMMNDLLGSAAIHDDDIGMPTVNGYAYYRYTRSGMLRMVTPRPSLLKAAVGARRKIGKAYWRDSARPRYVAAVAAWEQRPLAAVPDAELLAGVVELLDAGTVYYTAVQTIIPIAASSEVLLTQFYDRFVRREGDPPAPTMLLGFDSAPILAEKSLYDIATWARDHEDLAALLRTAPSAEVAGLLAADGPPAGVDEGTWKDWRARFQAHLGRFGHTVYNLDFVNPVPADDPAPLLDTVRFYLCGGGADPHERQRVSGERRDAVAAAALGRLDPARRAVLARLLRWAQGIAPIREDALADIGLAWPQLRRMLHELGSRLAASGVITTADDVYWLRAAEVLGSRDARLAVAVDERKALWRGRRRVTPPLLLPQGTVMERFESVMPGVAGEQAGNVLRGMGASSGSVTATARVLEGAGDFGRLQPGDVLVASITTPAWTSLFAMAGGVVTDIGGPLSHSSIVAREYGIPAVLGTGTATRRITDGARVHVDGDAGTVTLLEGDEEAPAAAPLAAASRAPAARRGRALAVAAVLAAVVLVLRRRRAR